MTGTKALQAAVCNGSTMKGSCEEMHAYSVRGEMPDVGSNHNRCSSTGNTVSK